MKRVKAITGGSCVLAPLSGIPIPIVLLPSWLPCKDVLIAPKEVPRLRPLPG